MKTFIIVVETAIISFIIGGAWGMKLAEEKQKKQNEVMNTDENPA